MKYALICLALLLGFCLSSQAQFHQKTQNGVRQMNNKMNTVPMGIGNRGVKTTNRVSGVIVSREAIERAKLVGAKVGVNWEGIDIREAKIYGRTIDHPDGTYTEERRDDNPENQVSRNLVIQETKSKNGTVVLLRRSITLNQYGQPEEVMIHDGAGNYKYRGVFVYDSVGRISNELLYDAKGTALRRTIQDYDMQGNPEPLKTVDYVKNVPKDLQLVVTRIDPLIQEVESEAKRQGLLQNRKGSNSKANKPSPRLSSKGRQSTRPPTPRAQTVSAQPLAPQPVSEASSPPAEPKKRRGLFGRFKK